MKRLFEGGSVWLERKLVPPLSILAGNIYVQAVRDAFIIFTMPLVIAGSIFLLLAHPPIPLLAELLRPYYTAILVPYQLTFGFMALFLAFGVAYSLARYRYTEPVQPSLLAMVLFLEATLPVRDLATLKIGSLLPYMSGEGLFVAILIGIVSTEGMHWFRQSRFTIRLPTGVPQNVTRAFEALLPTLLLITLFWALEWFVSSHSVVIGDKHLHLTLPFFFMLAFKPLVMIQNSYPAAVLEIVLIMVLWSVGIHGLNVVTAIAAPFWFATLASNAAHPGSAQGIVTEPFFYIFTCLGGSGATLPLVIYLLRSRSVQLRTVGRVALGPAIFNMNESIIFGMPIALNPLLLLPFIVVPVIIVTINYFVFSCGLVQVPLVLQPFTVPVGVSGIIATGGDLKGALLQLGDLAVAALIYYPFFKTWERVLIKGEAEAMPAEQAQIPASVDELLQLSEKR